MKISKTKTTKNLVDSSWLKLELDQEWQMPCKLWACVCVWHLWSGGLKTQDMNGRVGRCLGWYPVKILVYHCRAWFSWLLHSLHFERHHSRFWSIYLQIQSSWLSWNQATSSNKTPLCFCNILHWLHCSIYYCFGCLIPRSIHVHPPFYPT